MILPISAFLLVVAATVAVAAPGVIVTVSGQRYEGEIVERGDEVIVSIRGGQVVLQRGDVMSLEYVEPFQKQFLDRLQKLDPDDVQGRIDLAVWAMEKEQYTAAREAIWQAEALDPNNADIVRLEAAIRAQLRMRGHRQPENRPIDPPPPTRPRDEPVAPPENESREGMTGPAVPLVSADTIADIRRAEWRPGDVVRVRVDTKTARDFADSQNRPWRMFGGLRAGEQAEEILLRGNARQRQGVTILSDPPVVLEFRRTVQPTILTGCAAVGCHGRGGVNDELMFLLISPADSEPAAYTNFHTLMTSVRVLEPEPPVGGNIFGGAAEVRMVERGGGGASAARSLLLQYALPRDVAQFDHPDVPGYQPIFQSLSDPRAGAILDWIRSLSPLPAVYQSDAAPTTAPSGN